MGNKIFLSGTPTGSDVRKLIEAFKQPDVGTEITHERIETVIGYQRKSNRYKTVVTAWRHKLHRDNSIDMGAIKGIGYQSLADNERVANGVTGVQQGTRKQFRSIKKAVTVDTKDPILRKKQDLLSRYASVLQDHSVSFRKELRGPKPTEQMVRLPPANC
jgi:hypothetical protein